MNFKILLKARLVKNKKNKTRIVMKVIIKGTCENNKEVTNTLNFADSSYHQYPEGK